MRWTDSEGSVDVFTEREGLLSRMGHDLRLRVGRFEVSVDEAAGRASVNIDATSLHCASAVVSRRDDRGLLSEHDRREIERHLHEEVLETQRFPAITFSVAQIEATGESRRLHGELTIRGKSRATMVELRRSADAWTGEILLRQTAFGITPYRAPLGALRVRDEVRVAIQLRSPA